MILDTLCLLNIHIRRRFSHTTGNGVNRMTRVYCGCSCGRHVAFIGTSSVRPLNGNTLTRRRPF